VVPDGFCLVSRVVLLASTPSEYDDDRDITDIFAEFVTEMGLHVFHTTR
jgi:hypothetical protein